MRQLICALALLAACGGEKEAAQTAAKPDEATGPPDRGGAGAGAVMAQQAAPVRTRSDEIEQERARLQARKKELKAALDELEARHAKENEALPGAKELSRLRRSFTRLKNDAIRSSIKIRKMRARLEALQKHAEGASAGALKTLQEKRREIEKRLRKATSGWQAALAEESSGRVDESPVKRTLDTVRAIKQHWFEATHGARRAKPNASERKAVNRGFRAWLAEVPLRKQVCGKILSQPGGPRGKTPDNYDFTRLDFFILVELLENEIDKQNITVEKQEAKKNEVVVDKITAELDAVNEKIVKAMQSGGPELEEYLDLKSRFKGADALDRRIQSIFLGARETVDQMREIRARHAEERRAAETALDEVRRKLRALPR